MDVRVLKAFYDRNDGVERKPDSVFACTEARFKEIEEALPGTLEKKSAAKRTSRRKAE